MRRMGYAYATENIYCDWVRRFIKFSQMDSREDLFVNAENKVEKFLTDLAVKQNVASSTQNQAFNALVFLYAKVLKRPLDGVDAARSRKEPRIPVVLSIKEVKKVLAKLSGTNVLMVQLLYGGGLRISELVRCAYRILILNTVKLRCVMARAKKTVLPRLHKSLFPC